MRGTTPVSPGLPVTFAFGVKPLCEIVIPVVRFAAVRITEATRRNMSVTSTIIETIPVPVGAPPATFPAYWNTPV